MINPRISADLSTAKPIGIFSCTRHVQEVHTKAEVIHPTPGRGSVQYSRIGNVLGLTLESRSTTKPITPFSCTPRVQEVHTKAESYSLALVTNA